MKNVVIIGGGASGLMSAIWAARCGANVTILEQNEKVGKKILATGNGRCNLTNRTQNATYYRSDNTSFPWKIISQFPAEETVAFFEELGIYFKDKNGWLYPYTEQAASVTEVLELEARHRKVKIKSNEEVVSIAKTKDGFEVLTKTWKYACECVIIACGSHASSVEGSSDMGYQLAKGLGHTLISPLPALCALKGKGNYFAKWAGTKMDTCLRLEIDHAMHIEERGEVLLTDYGISGICVFQVSRFATRAIFEGKQVQCHLDFMPEFSEKQLLELLERRRMACPYKSTQELLVGLLPKKLIPLVVTKKCTDEMIVHQLKDWVLPIKEAYSIKQAQVCCGGVDTKELTTSLESKLQPGIFFAGEVIDVDGPCGGYNLQWAWSSGAVAGKGAATL